jgi:hypothetical protein
MTIDTLTLRNTLNSMPVPAPNTPAHWRYLLLKGHCTRACQPGVAYNHETAKLVFAGVLGLAARPVWRWIDADEWHEGLPPGYGVSDPPYKRIRMAALPNHTAAPVLDQIIGRVQQWAETQYHAHI